MNNSVTEITAVCLAILVGAAPTGVGETSEKTKTHEIGHISTEIPKMKLPAIEGQSEKQLVSDTLDLEERARFAI